MSHEARARAYVLHWFCQNNEVLWKRGGQYQEEVAALVRLLAEAERRVWEEARRAEAIWQDDRGDFYDTYNDNTFDAYCRRMMESKP